MDTEIQINYTLNLNSQIMVPIYSAINMNKTLVILLFDFVLLDSIEMSINITVNSTAWAQSAVCVNIIVATK